MDDHLLNATYYSPEIEEPLESTAMLGNIVHSDSPTHHHHGHHVESAGSVGKLTFDLWPSLYYYATRLTLSILFISARTSSINAGETTEQEHLNWVDVSRLSAGTN